MAERKEDGRVPFFSFWREWKDLRGTLKTEAIEEMTSGYWVMELWGRLRLAGLGLAVRWKLNCPCSPVTRSETVGVGCGQGSSGLGSWPPIVKISETIKPVKCYLQP